MSWMSQMLVFGTLIAVGLSWKVLTRGLKKDPYSMHFIIPLILAVGIILIEYFDKFGFDPNNRNIKDWVDGAVYLNNMLTPILLLATIYLLYRTWLTSKQELADARDIMRKKEELELLRSRVQLLNKFLDTTPSDYLDFKADVMVLNINSETNGVGFLNDLQPLLNRTKRLLLNEESLFIFNDARVFTALKAINTSIGNNAPTYRDIFSTQIKHGSAVYMSRMRSGLEERTDEEIKLILSNLVRLLYKETYFAECRDNKDYDVNIEPIKHQDMLVTEMALSIIQLVKNSNYECELFNEYRFHFSSMEFAGLQELTNSNSL
ncbi:hypothetical protein [Pseudoalteromonas sp. OOF1S-7]|uniref:hypothetical protein n=1 Tax=Pseudoalteromonas sp. OOF1S-7 TaxID=2917757 RepID=UPI001EF4D9B4|nr:hypothetical protein [Pseudoalteromonas sp. OOF1S-7]MCG7535467.1 hypothetical protein [Pseudoalteromonas sp. OOF1S-7]